MQLALTLPADVAAALRRYASLEAIEIELAAVIAVREWLIQVGYLEVANERDGDIPTEGNA